MNKQGYILLHRKIQEHWLWPSGREFTECEAWIWLLMKAAHSTHKERSDKKVFTVNLGEMLISIKEMAEIFGWGWRRTKLFLDNLKNDDMIDIADCTRYSIRLRINKYAAFQGKNEDGCRADDIADDTPDGIGDDEMTAILTSWNHSQGEGKGLSIINGKECKRNTSSPKYSEEDFLTAEFIYSKIQEMNPTHKQPNFPQWANTIRLMREADKRTDEQIRELFTWANQDDFWATNILSPATLRKQWDKLTIKRNKAQVGHGMNSAFNGDKIIV